MKPDQERVKNLLADTVTLLCKNGLNFSKELRVQGLIGITLDDDDVFIVHINEKLSTSADDAAAAVQDSEKENSGKPIAKPVASASTNEKPAALGCQSLGAENCEKMLQSSIMFSAPDSNREESDLLDDASPACAIVKVEKVENLSVSDQPGPYDKMVDFASFLPDFSSARYATDLSNLHHGNLALPGMPEISRCSKRKRNSGPQMEFLPKSSGSGGDCPDGVLIGDAGTQGSLPVLPFQSSHGRIRRTGASGVGNNSDMLLDQNVGDISAGLPNEFSRARATTSTYFDVGVECTGQSSQMFDSQQFVGLNYRWKRRSQHSLEKPFHCSVPGCSRSYWNMPDLYRHRKMNHGICGRVQARKKLEQELQANRSQQ